eukprot:9092583-Pyramimonas_sp.AAC.1
MVFWEDEEHEVAYSWLPAFKMWSGNGVLVHNVAWEWCSGESPDLPGFTRPTRNLSVFAVR